METDVQLAKSAFSIDGFEHAQRVAVMLSKSSLIPKEFQGNVQNTMIALEMAHRIGASPLMVMQHLYIVHGKPSWSSTFIISAINSCGRFDPLRFEVTGSGDDLSCVAWTTEKGKTERIEGPAVTMKMAHSEGWVSKNGSKWKTMPELMIRYRAAAFFGRLYAPEITMGMHTQEEVMDIPYEDVAADREFRQQQLLEQLQDMFEEKKHALSEPQLEAATRIIETKEAVSYQKLYNELSAVQVEVKEGETKTQLFQ